MSSLKCTKGGQCLICGSWHRHITAYEQYKNYLRAKTDSVRQRIVQRLAFRGISLADAKRHYEHQLSRNYSWRWF